ncbi:MAG TPA: translocation/assembly module TamB domain-containing protein [Chthoniobacterales bacterium]
MFHAPILRAVIRAVATKVAAHQNLKLDFRLDGDPIDGITLRNLHATPTGPSAVQSLDAGEVKVDYSIPDLVFHGMSDALKNVEVHDVTAVIDSSKAAIPTPTPTPAPNEKVSLPAFFPDRLVATNVNLTIKKQPQDMIVKDLNLGLYPKRQGQLQIDKVQIPGVHTWTNIHGTATYADKNLYIHNLTLDDHNQLQVVNVDASKIGEGKVGVQIQGSLGGGDIASQMELSAEGTSFGTKTKLQAKGISLGQLGQYLGQPAGKIAGEVKDVKINWQGKLDAPASWNGTIDTEINNLHANGLSLDHVKLDLEAANGQATVREARIDQGNNHVQLRGSVELPKTTAGFGQTPGNFQIAIDAPNLQQLTAFMAKPATGSLQANGNVKTGNGTISLDLKTNGNLLGFDGAAVRQLTATISATKQMPAPGAEKPESIYAGLRTNLQAALHDLRYANYALDSVQVNLKSENEHFSLNPLIASRAGNLLQMSADFQLPQPNEKLIDQPVAVKFSLQAPQLADYWQADAPNQVNGQLQLTGNLRARGGVANGQISLTGQEISAQKLLVKQLDLQATIADNVLHVRDLSANLNARDYVQAQATVNLAKPFRYSGNATVNLADLSTFAPLLSTPEKKMQLAGALVLNWNGEGDAASFKNNGTLKLSLTNGRYPDLQNLQAKVEAHYSPNELNVPIVYVGSDKLSFQAILDAKDSTLQISKIQIDQGEAKYATAYAAIPFTWSNLGTQQPLFPPNGKVQINFESANLDLAKLFQNLGAKPPVSGQLTLKLDASGPLGQLQANLNLQLQNLEAAAVKKLSPAKIDLSMHLQNNELNLLGKLAQSQIQPVQISAKLPLNVSKLIATKKLDEQTPLTAKIEMPRSSINFLREFVPALRQLDGNVALNVNVGGTIAKPGLSGAADMTINLARFENSTLPALTNFKAQLAFRDNTLNFERFGGDLAGGPFTLSGRITLPKLTEPNFDLRLKANSVLVARNDTLTARVDADIKVEGPLKSASVSGQVLTTNSRFFRDIDIIPISLPGRPAPLPEPPSAAPTLSFPNPPLRDWKFDVVIKSKDPFLIRGNLATGSAVVDMKLAGTGLHPQLQGQVRLENFDATLPFSTLTVSLGFLYFDPNDPLNPRIELQGQSLIQDYTINVYIYGTANAPRAVFNSEPPLPQEDIISLLATGVTRSNLSGSNVLASRALLLLGKELYRKVFKKGSSDEQPKSDSIFSRLSVEYSGADPRTGEQTAEAKYKVSDNVVLVGDLGIAGGFRGQVKYLIRFR